MTRPPQRRTSLATQKFGRTNSKWEDQHLANWWMEYGTFDNLRLWSFFAKTWDEQYLIVIFFAWGSKQLSRQVGQFGAGPCADRAWRGGKAQPGHDSKKPFTSIHYHSLLTLNMNHVMNCNVMYHFFTDFQTIGFKDDGRLKATTSVPGKRSSSCSSLAGPKEKSFVNVNVSVAWYTVPGFFWFSSWDLYGFISWQWLSQDLLLDEMAKAKFLVEMFALENQPLQKSDFFWSFVMAQKDTNKHRYFWHWFLKPRPKKHSNLGHFESFWAICGRLQSTYFGIFAFLCNALKNIASWSPEKHRKIPIGRPIC